MKHIRRLNHHRFTLAPQCWRRASRKLLSRFDARSSLNIDAPSPSIICRRQRGSDRCDDSAKQVGVMLRRSRRLAKHDGLWIKTAEMAASVATCENRHCSGANRKYHRMPIRFHLRRVLYKPVPSFLLRSHAPIRPHARARAYALRPRLKRAGARVYACTHTLGHGRVEARIHARTHSRTH